MRQHDEAMLDLDNQFCAALYVATRAVMRAYSEELKAIDLTYPQYLAMLVLWEWTRQKHERPTLKALGERLDTDSGTLTPLLRRLEEKGLITRRRISDDERELFLHVTPEGARLKRRARAVSLRMLARSPVSPLELARLREQLKCFRGELQTP